MISPKWFLGGVLLFVGVSMKGMFSSGLSLHSLNEGQIGTLDQFRNMVEWLDLPLEFMKDDAYLLRYLAPKDFNLQEAFNNFERILSARKSDNIDSILDEDWSEYEKRFPFSLSSRTKDGRPVMYFAYGKMDVGKEMAAGNFKGFVRSAMKALEEADRKVHSMREDNNSDVAQFDIILDLEGYTLEKHGCLQCLQAYIEVTKQSESLYKEAAKNIFIINAPAVYEAVFPWLSTFILDEKTREAVRLLGGRTSYEPVLLQNFERNQFPKELRN